MRPFRSLLARSIRTPRAGIAEVLATFADRESRMGLFGLATILPTLLIFGVFSLQGAGVAFPIGPFLLLLVQGMALLFVSALAFLVGRWRGGRGSFRDCLAALAWLQVVASAAQLAFLVLELALPFLGALIGIAALVLVLWLAANYLAEVHGFQNVGLVGLGIVGTLFLTSFAMTLLMSVLGAGNV